MAGRNASPDPRRDTRRANDVRAHRRDAGAKSAQIGVRTVPACYLSKGFASGSGVIRLAGLEPAGPHALAFRMRPVFVSRIFQNRVLETVSIRYNVRDLPEQVGIRRVQQD